MRNLHRTSWFITLLSALLFNLAWLSFYTGWLVIASFLLLFCQPVGRPSAVALAKAEERGSCLFLHGFVWGLLVFSFHFHWLAQALMKHGSCGVLLASALVVPVLCYFSVLTGFWFYAMQLVSGWWRPLIVPVSVLFWYLLDAYGLMLFGMGMGYPFINPCLPLVRYQWFLIMLSSLFSTAVVQHETQPLVDQLCYVQPVVNRAWCYGELWTRSPHAVVQRLHKQIASGRLPAASVLVGPESTAPFALDEYSELVKALCPKSNDNRCVILGALRKKGDRIEQVAHCLQRGLIIKTYVKKILVPFAEQTPPAWQWLQALRHRLSPALAECTAGAINVDVDEHFYVAGCRVRPALCLEFFEQPSRALCGPDTDAIMVLVNDSWYTQYFREWLFLLAILKSHTTQRLVVYIGHYGCYTIEPKNHSITHVRSCYASLHA